MKKINLLVLLILCSLFSKAQPDLFDINTIQKIEIQFPFSDWDYRMDTAKGGSDGYIVATWVKINGVQFDSAGVQYKGNSSYNASNNKNPIHIELDYVINQSYQGYSDLKLANGFADPAVIREALAYNLLGNYMHCSKSNFAQVYINDSLYGLFCNSESVGKDFLSQHFYSNTNATFKCEPENYLSSFTPKLTYYGTDSSLYYSSYEIKSQYGWNDLSRFIDTLNNNSGSIEVILDVDRALWMLAFNNAMVHLDSYTGMFSHNYYLYMDDNNRFNTINWDVNMAFGGFNMPGPTLFTFLSVAQMQNLSPLLHSAVAARPLIKNLLANAQYKKMYLAHMKTMTNEMITSGEYLTQANQMRAIIDTAVLSDPYPFYTYSQFVNSLTTSVPGSIGTIPGIQELMDPRSTYLNSTPEFLAVAPVVSGIAYSPASPNLNDTVWITASVVNQNYTYLGYRDAIQNIFQKIQMYDDGLHNDGTAADGTFGACIVATSPAMQYYIYAENSSAGIFSPERAEFNFYTILANVTSINPGDVTINEIMSSNAGAVQDQDGEYEDWVELYNTTSNNVSLANIYATDNFASPLKWLFPSNAVIPPNDYLIVWLDQDTSQAGLHANFKLSGSGEELMLSYAGGPVLDSVIFGPIATDLSSQRCPNGTGPFAIMAPTHNTENCYVGISEVNKQSTISVYPNPAKDYLNVVSDSEFNQVIMFNGMGQVVETFTVNNVRSLAMNMSGFSNGIYFIKIGERQELNKIIISH